MTLITQSSDPAGAVEEQSGGRRGDAARRRWQCVCGQDYRITGVDRHRVYWPIDAPADGAVLDGCCVVCRRPLPGKHPHCADDI
jgi:hypothetical protein